MDKTNSALRQGVLLYHGAYRIERAIGRGGFGITYLATNTQLDTKVAIKEFFPKGLLNRDDDSTNASIASKENTKLTEKFKAKFVKEARRIAQLNHPSIVRVTGAFEEFGTAYYVMDYFEGNDLQSLVRQNGPLSIQQAVGLINQIGSALEYLHSLHINHLDVKPANILVDPKTDKAVLIDFGLSKQYDNEGDQTSTTPVGISEGYAPLEQYQNGGLQTFSAPTDIYALGATLYYLLTGKRPPSAQELMETELDFTASVPDYLRRAISRAMQPRRADRYPTITAFLKDVNHSADVNPPVPADDDDDTIIAESEDTVIKTHTTGYTRPPKPEPPVTPNTVTSITPENDVPTMPKKKIGPIVWSLVALGILLTALSFSRPVLFTTATVLGLGGVYQAHWLFAFLIGVTFIALTYIFYKFGPQKNKRKILCSILIIGAFASIGVAEIKLENSYNDDNQIYNYDGGIWAKNVNGEIRIYNSTGQNILALLHKYNWWRFVNNGLVDLPNARIVRCTYDETKIITDYANIYNNPFVVTIYDSNGNTIWSRETYSTFKELDRGLSNLPWDTISTYGLEQFLLKKQAETEAEAEVPAEAAVAEQAVPDWEEAK